MNLVPAELGEHGGAGLAVRLDDGLVWPVPAARRARYANVRDRPVIFGLRPENFRTDAGAGDGEVARLEAVAEVIEPLGSDTLVFFSLREHELVARLPPERAVRAGETLTLYPDLGRMHLFDRETGRAI